MAVYPLSARTKGRDIGLLRNPSGRLSRVRYAPGPDRKPRGSTRFLGRPGSYIEFPNTGRLDTRKSITLLAWIYHEGSAGPIFNYKPNGWGVHFWMIAPNQLFVRFNKRGSLRSTPALASRRVRPRRWAYVGATYDFRTGVAKLFINRRFVTRKRIGRFRLATNYPARMGSRTGDRRHFRGRISCMQVYSQALSRKQIMRRRKRCFRRGEARLPARRCS